MKKIITFIALCICMSAANSAGTTKQVCKNRIDKAGKTVKECKTIKVHKKLNGKTVPTKK